MESIIREIAAHRKKPVTALAHWFAIFSLPPPRVTKIASRPPSQGTRGGAAVLTAHNGVYIPEPLPKIAAQDAQLALEQRRKGKAWMALPLSTGVPPNEPVSFTIFREEWEPTAQPPVVEEEPELVIPTQVLESLYTEDSSGEKWKWPKPVLEIRQRIEITTREWDTDTTQPIEELPRISRRISPNLELDTHVEILEFVEEEDQHSETMSIKQCKKKKANQRERESRKPSEKSGKVKCRKTEAGGSH